MVEDRRWPGARSVARVLPLRPPLERPMSCQDCRLHRRGERLRRRCLRCGKRKTHPIACAPPPVSHVPLEWRWRAAGVFLPRVVNRLLARVALAGHPFAVCGFFTTAPGCLASRRIGLSRFGTGCFVDAQLLLGHTVLAAERAPLASLTQ